MEAVKELIEVAGQNGWTIGSAESLTAGLFSATIASCPGASAVLKGGYVSYFTEMKERMLDVPALLIERFGVVSKPCARAMALNAQRLMDVDFAVSFTGNAGPSAMEGKPAGLVYCAVAKREGTVFDFRFQWDGLARNEIRARVVADMVANTLTIMKEESEWQKRQQLRPQK